MKWMVKETSCEECALVLVTGTDASEESIPRTLLGGSLAKLRLSSAKCQRDVGGSQVQDGFCWGQNRESAVFSSGASVLK